MLRKAYTDANDGPDEDAEPDRHHQHEQFRQSGDDVLDHGLDALAVVRDLYDAYDAERGELGLAQEERDERQHNNDEVEPAITNIGHNYIGHNYTGHSYIADTFAQR